MCREREEGAGWVGAMAPLAVSSTETYPTIGIVVVITMRDAM